jgi:phospholipid/cholesterol/gamma-HCH transport system substrate-binding protein
MHDVRRRFRLGLFVLGTGGLFVALLAFILQNSLSSERASYFILFAQNVKGLVTGSRVNFQGVPIGQVRDIRFQDGKTLVELRVDPSRASIQDVTCARMDRLLVTGQVTIELEGYTASGRPLAPGAVLQVKEDPMQALTASIPEVVDRAATLLQRLDTLVGRAESLVGDDNRAAVAATLGHLQRTAARLEQETATEAGALLRDGRAAVADVRRVGTELQALAREATALAGGVRGPLQGVLVGFRAACDDVRALARQLKLAPDSLLFGVERPAAPAGGER